MMLIDNEFKISQTVYLKTDAEQNECIVTGICVRANGYLQYEISCGFDTIWVNEFEVSAQKDLIKTSTN